jgi:hypothetical protein
MRFGDSRAVSSAIDPRPMVASARLPDAALFQARENPFKRFDADERR